MFKAKELPGGVTEYTSRRTGNVFLLTNESLRIRFKGEVANEIIAFNSRSENVSLIERTDNLTG